MLRRAGYLQTCLLTKPESTEVETPPVQPELAPTLVLPLSFVTPPAQQELVLSQQRGASPSATRSTTLRSDSRHSADSDMNCSAFQGSHTDCQLLLRSRTGQSSRSKSHMFVSTTLWRRSSLLRPGPQVVRES